MKKYAIVIYLLVLCVSAFVIRLNSVRNSEWRSTDELLFHSMAVQVNKNIADYNAIPFSSELIDQGRYVPKYMLQPLYKHPPLYTYLAAASIRFFGDSETAAACPSILFGVLLIPLTYLLGRLLFSLPVALTAAFCVWIDPIMMITSQKIWMDTALAFFTVLAVYWFARALFRQNNIYFLLSGIASGLAVNTKYTGYLATIAVGAYALLYCRRLFRNKIFCLSIIIPLLMLLPWLLWNINVYGLELLSRQMGMHTGIGDILQIAKSKAHWIGAVALFTVAALVVLRKYWAAGDQPERDETSVEEEEESEEPNPVKRYISYGICGYICYLILPNIINALQPHFIPVTSWQIGFFHGQPIWFYFGRLVEFSFIYLPGLLCLFLYQPQRDAAYKLSVTATAVILIFFLCWGNYQSRYILACLPFLLLLSSDVLVRAAGYLNTRASDGVWRGIRAGYYVLLAWFLYHSVYINFHLSYPNDLCYF